MERYSATLLTLALNGVLSTQSVTAEIIEPIDSIAFDLRFFYSIVVVGTFCKISCISGIKLL